MLITKFLISNKITKHFYIILFLSLSMIKFINCQDEFSDPSGDGEIVQEEPRDPFSYIDVCYDEEELYIYNTYCFNQIIIFDHKKYQVNNFAKNKDEDFLIQYSEYTKYVNPSSSRLFYGLTKDGRYLFSNESSYSNEFNVVIEEEIF